MEEIKYKKEKIDVNSDDFDRKKAYERWSIDKNPWLDVTGEFDVKKLYKFSKKNKVKFNAVMMFCIQNAAQKIKNFHYVIKTDGVYYYEKVYTNLVMQDKNKDFHFPGIKFCDTLVEFLQEYDEVYNFCYENCVDAPFIDGALVSTSAVVNYPFKAFSVGMSDTFWDPFMMWGGYQKQGRKIVLSITLRVHHGLFNGIEIGQFFNELQAEFNKLKGKL